MTFELGRRDGMSAPQFRIGDFVTVIANTERSFFLSLVGRRGTIIDIKSNVAVIQFGKNKHDIACITVDDLALQSDRDIDLLT